jgi:hypothetical protein
LSVSELSAWMPIHITAANINQWTSVKIVIAHKSLVNHVNFSNKRI